MTGWLCLCLRLIVGLGSIQLSTGDCENRVRVVDNSLTLFFLYHFGRHLTRSAMDDVNLFLNCKVVTTR